RKLQCAAGAGDGADERGSARHGQHRAGQARLEQHLMWRKVAREPLLHFLLAGLVLFGLAEHHRRAADQYRIVITPERIAGLENAYAGEFGSPPAPSMLPKLIDDYVASEVLFREATARGRDRDDEIIRR